MYERTKNEADIFTSKHGLNSVVTVRSIDELVERNDIELVVVCSPIEYHYEHALACLTANKHVLVEKAFCSTFDQAKQITKIASEKGLICVPYQNRRYDCDFLTLQELLRKNVLGDIAEYNGFFNRYAANVRVNNWKDTVPGSGGNFLSLGSHMIDQAVVLFGSPQRIYCDIRAQRDGAIVDDCWEVHLYYNSNGCDAQGLHKGGFRAILKGSLLCHDHSLRYMVHGKEGSWNKHGMDNQEEYLMKDNLPTYEPNPNPTSEAVSAVPYGVEVEANWGKLTRIGIGSGNSTDSSVIQTPSKRGSYYMIYDEIYSNIVDNTPMHVSSQVPLTVMKIIDLAYISSREGRVVDMETI